MNDEPSALAPYLDPPPILVVITGPSGVGKDSVIDILHEQGLEFEFVVTMATRDKRDYEIDGRDYNFVSVAEFRRMIEDGELLEHAEVYGQYKGVPRLPALRALASGRDVVMRLDVQGADRIREIVPQTVTIFLAPPSLEVLDQRLRDRGTDNCEQVRTRMAVARDEVACAAKYDYIVINRQNDLVRAAREVSAIITAERLKSHRQPVSL